MDGISDDTKRALVLALQMDVEERGEAIEEMEAKLEAREGRVGDMPDLSSDKLLVFLAENVAGLQVCPRESKSAYVRGLLDIYLLQRQKGAQLPATAPQGDAFPIASLIRVAVALLTLECLALAAHDDARPAACVHNCLCARNCARRAVRYPLPAHASCDTCCAPVQWSASSCSRAAARCRTRLRTPP